MRGGAAKSLAAIQDDWLCRWKLTTGGGTPKCMVRNGESPKKSRKTWMIWSYPHFKETSTFFMDLTELWNSARFPWSQFPFCAFHVRTFSGSDIRLLHQFERPKGISSLEFNVTKFW